MDSYDFILITLIIALLVLIFVGNWLVVGIVAVFVFLFAMYYVFLYYQRNPGKVVYISSKGRKSKEEKKLDFSTDKEKVYVKNKDKK
tara:strand:+ start:7589 stop:7849 length:261 start_codon:yes stop_codon:yes gene_type:complete